VSASRTHLERLLGAGDDARGETVGADGHCLLGPLHLETLPELTPDPAALADLGADRVRPELDGRTVGLPRLPVGSGEGELGGGAEAVKASGGLRDGGLGVRLAVLETLLDGVHGAGGGNAGVGRPAVVRAQEAGEGGLGDLDLSGSGR
jgi:hypothetical protein